MQSAVKHYNYPKLPRRCRLNCHKLGRCRLWIDNMKAGLNPQLHRKLFTGIFQPLKRQITENRSDSDILTMPSYGVLHDAMTLQTASLHSPDLGLQASPPSGV